MKSMTSRSPAPRLSCSRMGLRRSTASSALESASVWFWHTRQRSSVASAATRFSRTALSWFSAITAKASATKQKTKNLLTLERLDERQDLLRQHLRGHRADLLKADDALLVDHVRLRHAIDAVVHADLAVGIVERGAVGIAVARQPFQPVFAPVLVVQAVERHAGALRKLHQ